MELIQWFCMGILFTLGVEGFVYLSMKVKMPWYAWAIKITGAVLILFGIGWAGASFFEGIAQSGALGLIVFSMTGLVMIILSWRYFVPKNTKLW